jgi:hypothetical protein
MIHRERRLTLKQLIDEFKSKKNAKTLSDEYALDPSIGSLSREKCEELVIYMMFRYTRVI